jgi:hypothetical protein
VALAEAIAEIRAAYAGDPGFGGIAVHSAESLPSL